MTSPVTWPRVSRWNSAFPQAWITGLLISFLVPPLLSGCAWRQAGNQADFDGRYSAGNYQEAAAFAARRGGGGYNEGTSLLWTLQRASALQAAGDHQEAIRLFDTTEAFFRVYDEEGALSRWLSTTGALITNDASRPYRGTLYDAIMVNSYKALGFLALGEPANARVELNRARDRQRRAVDAFSEQIRAEQRALAESGSETPEADMGATLSRAHDALDEEYEQLSRWSVYPDYVNPLATWLEGLFLMTRAEAPGDFERAAQALERASGMVPGNPWVRADYQWAEDLAAGRRRHAGLPRTVWVLYEKGLGPVKVERRIQVPVALRHSGTTTIYTGFAYPVLRYRLGVSSPLQLESGREEDVSTELLSSMEAVVSTEFSYELPRIVTRAVAASVTRTLLQYQLRRRFGDFAGFLGLIYQLVGTQADTRIWSSLPREFAIARSGWTQGEPVQLRFNGESHALELPDNRFVMVWVRQPSVAADPLIEVIPLSAD
ncbi:COG3014 family protein [Halospina denitrificans]|uniref:COG3014 family protein n=1 Tax=Halospina denitrificans TaxID=332522 RepID=UPI0010602B77|nr:hypothetical protein [Halospina denitrificans]